jgi:hypothetical protein
MSNITYVSKYPKPTESKPEDLLEYCELCDVCSKTGINLYRTSFMTKRGIEVVIRHHGGCDPKGYFESTFG